MRIAAAIIVLAGALAYMNSLRVPLVLDDSLTLLENPGIQDWRRLDRVLFPARELPVAGRPLVNLSFALNYAVGGTSVSGYHVVNLAIHLACGLVLFGLVRRTLLLPRIPDRLGTRSGSLAFAVALI